MKNNLLVPVSLAVTLSAQIALAGAPPGSRVIGWGVNYDGRATGIPTGLGPYSANWATGMVSIAGQVLTDAVAVAAGEAHSHALRRDGTVVGWGCSGSSGINMGIPTGSWAITNGPVMIGGQILSNVAGISARGNYSLALKKDGTVVGWGSSYGGEPIYGVLPVSNVVAIAAGSLDDSALALQGDGTLVSVWKGKATPSGLSNVVAIAHSSELYWPALALRSNGTVAINEDPVNYWKAAPPAGLSNVVAIAAGAYHYIVLKSDGTVFGWGENINGQVTGTPSKWVEGDLTSESAAGFAAPGGTTLSNVVAIAASGGLSIGIKKDGTVVGWGLHSFDIPSGLSNVVAVAVGLGHCLAITTNISGLGK